MMKETVKSLRIYFIVVGGFNIFYVIKEMIVNSSALHVGSILTFAVGVMFIYYGIKLHKYIKHSPKTLMNFTYIVCGLTAVSSFLREQWFLVVMMIFIAGYLVYSIKKISARLKKEDSSK